VVYSVELFRSIAAYKPYEIEEPICPEHVEGYARIKGETGVTIVASTGTPAGRLRPFSIGLFRSEVRRYCAIRSHLVRGHQGVAEDQPGGGMGLRMPMEPGLS
jgi:hypothetical protein